jgi:hypothetical protein
MGSRGGFDNGMADGCVPVVGLTRLMSKSSFERIHHSSRCMLARMSADFTRW